MISTLVWILSLYIGSMHILLEKQTKTLKTTPIVAAILQEFPCSEYTPHYFSRWFPYILMFNLHKDMVVNSINVAIWCTRGGHMVHKKLSSKGWVVNPRKPGSTLYKICYYNMYFLYWLYDRTMYSQPPNDKCISPKWLKIAFYLCVGGGGLYLWVHSSSSCPQHVYGNLMTFAEVGSLLPPCESWGNTQFISFAKFICLQFLKWF